MAINEWWADDPVQTYWMQITDREDLTDPLLAPQLADDGNSEWSYELVRFVRPGDTVLHWHTRGAQRALVGYSTVAAEPGTTTMIWQSRGTSGQAHPSPQVEEPAWTAPLRDLTYFPAPITRDLLQAGRTEVLDLQARLKEAYGGGPLYLPFYDYGGRELRATQGYLVKFPAQLLEVFSLDSLPSAAAAKTAVEPSRRSRRGSGYLADVELKRAVERHAVRRAIELYDSEGYSCEDVGTTQSYDLRLRKGVVEVHVEVKGSTGDADTVELTSNEVSHSNVSPHETHLVVVDQIKHQRDAEGIITTGGRLRSWRAWQAHPNSLKPTRYRYQLPSEVE